MNGPALEACPHFTSGYDAVSVLRNQHACTIVASLLREDLDIQYQREVLRMNDGGHVTLDWPLSVPGYHGEEGEAAAEELRKRAAEAMSNASEDPVAAAAAASPEEAAEAAAVAAGLEGQEKIDSIVHYLQYGEASRSGGGRGDDDTGVPGTIGVIAGGEAERLSSIFSFHSLRSIKSPLHRAGILHYTRGGSHSQRGIVSAVR